MSNDAQIEESNMKDKDSYIQEIIKDIYSLSSPKFEESRKSQISGMIRVVVNGDDIKEYLVSDATIDSQLAVYVYILTNNRLIIVTIDMQDQINTYPFIISEMQKISFKSPKLDRISVEINLANNKLVGLEYSADKKETTDFFQKLDQLLTKQRQA